MAYSETNTFNFATVGVPQIGADFDIFETSSNPKFALGTGFTRSDGATFRYCHFGTAVTRGGTLVAQDISESGSGNSTTESRILAAASVTAIAGETIKPGTAGSHYIQYKNEGISADQFAGGYLEVTAGSGMGYTYPIKGNTASVQLTSGAVFTFYIELAYPLQQSLDGGSKVRIIGNAYANLESASSATDCLVAGVTTCSHAASTYGWVQDSGVAGVITDGSGIATGSVAALSDQIAGACAWGWRVGKISIVGASILTRPMVGYCVAGHTTKGCLSMIRLQL